MIQSAKNYDDQLGMSNLSARIKLMRMIIYDLKSKHENTLCFRCGKPIDNFKDFTIDHIEDWRNKDPNLFWDLNNIRFSHMRCNVIASVKKSRINNRKRKCKVCGSLENLQYDKLLCREHYLEYRKNIRDSKKKSGTLYFCYPTANRIRKYTDITRYCGSVWKCLRCRGHTAEKLPEQK